MWSGALLEMPLTWFEECWPLPAESLPELPYNLNIVALTLTVWPINSGVLTSLLLPHLSSSLTDSMPYLNLLCHSKTDARFMQDAPKAVWSIPYFSVAFFPSLKHSFIVYRSSYVSDCIFENHQLWQSGFSRVYSKCFCSFSFEPEIIKIGQSSHKMYSTNIVNYQVYNNFKCRYKKAWKLIEFATYIKLCRLFNAKSDLFIYIKYIRFLNLSQQSRTVPSIADVSLTSAMCSPLFRET